MDKGAWRATVHGVTKSQIQLKQLSMHAQSHIKLPVRGRVSGHFILTVVIILPYIQISNHAVHLKLK